MKYWKPISLAVLIIAAAILMYNILSYEAMVEYVVEDGVLVSCETNMKKVTVPQSVEGNQVIEIAANAFKDNSSIISLTLQSGIVKIDDNAFVNCTSMREINLPDSLVEITPEAFVNCSSLALINIDPGNIYFASLNGALYTAKIRQLVIFPSAYDKVDYFVPHGVVAIEEKALINSQIENIYFPETVESIGEKAFMGSKNLKSINLPPSITHVGDGAFIDTPRLNRITISDDVVLGSNLFGDNNFLESYMANGAGSYSKVGGSDWSFVR